jgi:DNA-binding HxlR family transcriptional regulator
MGTEGRSDADSTAWGDPYDPNCPSRKLLDLIGGRWTILIFGALEGGPQRFSQLSRRLGGVSPKVLTQVLRNLERDGLVSRKIYAEVPPRVEYTLTDLGRDLLQPLHCLRVWVETHLPDVLAARENAND